MVFYSENIVGNCDLVGDNYTEDIMCNNFPGSLECSDNKVHVATPVLCNHSLSADTWLLSEVLCIALVVRITNIRTQISCIQLKYFVLSMTDLPTV